MNTLGKKFLTVIQGEFAVSREPDVILSTVLGSCVAVCLFDPQRHIGGMNHYLLPGTRGGSGDSVRFGVNAMELLINEMQKNGADRGSIQAKLFGGANINQSGKDIGAANVAFGKEFLANEGIACLSESTGGTQARRLHFEPVTGAARQMIVPADEAPVAAPPPAAKPLVVAGEIDLF